MKVVWLMWYWMAPVYGNNGWEALFLVNGHHWGWKMKPGV